MFLYNFFHDSECDASQWRVVLNGFGFAHATGMPVFDAIKHAGICAEVLLPLYYVKGMANSFLSSNLFMSPLQGHETTYVLRIFQPKGNA